MDANEVVPQPDFFDGVSKRSKDRQIREVLDTLIVGSTMYDCRTLPDFLGEINAPIGSGDVAERQACYDGAFGARAMHHIQSYGAAEMYDFNAYTFTFTYSPSFLEIYTHHMNQPDGPNTPPHYHMTRFGAWALQSSRQSFADGAAAFRNLRDLARELPKQFLDDADRRMQPGSVKTGANLIVEGIQWVQESLPETSSFENAACKSQFSKCQRANNQGSQTSFSEASDDESDDIVTPEKHATDQGVLKHKATSKAGRIKNPALKYKPQTSTRVQKRRPSKARTKPKPRANTTTKSRQGYW